MALPLSPNTALAVDKIFAEADRAEATRLLTEHCADKLRGPDGENPLSLDDLRA